MHIKLSTTPSQEHKHLITSTTTQPPSIHHPLNPCHDLTLTTMLHDTTPTTSGSTTPPDCSALHNITSLVDSLISSSHSSRSFPGKWQSIRSKLEQLRSGLVSAAAATTTTTTTTTASSTSSSIGNLVLQELLHDITATVNDTHELVDSCVHGNTFLHGGRLLMLSNLDLAIAKLDLHTKSLAGLYTSGILTHAPNAIVLSAPPAGSSCDDARLYLKDLCSRLRIGNSEAKSHSLETLDHVLRNDDRFARIVASEMPELLRLLVSALEIRDTGIRRQAADALHLISSSSDSHKQALVMAGAIPALIQVLETGAGNSGKEGAARALEKLTENSDNAWSVSAHGGVTALLQICGDSAASTGLVSHACGVLRNLAPVAEIKAFMLEKGRVVPVLLKMLRSGDDTVQIHAMELLQSLVEGDVDDKVRIEAVREGAVEALVGVLDVSGVLSTSKAREKALRAIEALCFTSGNSMNLLMRSGFLERVLLLLRSGEISVQESALKAASGFCGLSEEAKRAMGEAGFMAQLVNLLDAPSVGVREMAARVLSSIVSVHRNRRRFVEEDAEEQNVGRILRVLSRSEEKPVTRKFLLEALTSLSDSNAGRKKIAASGYVESLEKLAEMEGSDAKRIVKKLSRRRRLTSFLHAFLGN